MKSSVTIVVVACCTVLRAQSSEASTTHSRIPKTWVDAEITSLELPLADPTGSPIHISADYYYKIPVRPIFKSYAVFAPGHEPAGYDDWLKQQEPVIVWDDQGHAPPLLTHANWVRAGEMVFDAAITYDGITTAADVRKSDWYSSTGVPLTANMEMPFYRYVIRQKGKVELGRLSCAACHTRVMPDGSTLKGAQGNFPFDRARASAFRSGRFKTEEVHSLQRGLFAAPWLSADPSLEMDRMSVEQISAAHDEVPSGVLGRHRSSLFYPVQIPDLIGVKNRRYLDRTGLQRHRSIVDLMRYAALNQGGDDLASYNGFVPVDRPRFRTKPAAGDPRAGGRYSEEQLYALALYLYSLEPPKNPNKFDDIAAQGKLVFEREGCAGCHPLPLGTNNKLTPVAGFTIPKDSPPADVLPVVVGTDPGLALKTRRGTGYYKVPSLLGVWYRGMFPHDGACAKLEDWFDARRLESDYVPTGFKGYGVKARPVAGHLFGLNLGAQEKRALLAFLRTL